MTETDATLVEAVTRKITAERVTIDCMNRKNSTDTRTGAMNGPTTSRVRRGNVAPRHAAVSSSAGGTWRKPVIVVRKPCVQ